MSEADKLARRIAEKLFEREGTSGVWAIKLEDAREGYARLSMRVRADMLNGHAIAHGGMIFALADTAFAYACNSRNESTVAQHASVTFLAPAQLDDVLIAEAREVSRAGRSGTYAVSIRTDDGRVIAEFNGLSRSIGGAVIDEA
jgi:acyl-CoA thioesterase